MRDAFSVIMAIFVIVIMSSISVLVLNISGKTVKTTTTQYKYEQAALYAKSYTELAIMYATANDPTTGNCAESINGAIGTNIANGDGYNIQVDIQYIGDGISCTPLNGSKIITNNERQIIIDVYIQYHDDSVASAWSGTGTVPWITYYRRTLQKL